MKFYRYWRKSKYQKAAGNPNISVQCFGYSDQSLEDALIQANQRAQRVATTIADRKQPDRYDYGGRPMREELIEEFEENGRLIAIVSRNAYGALVLNTPDLFIADIDLPQTGVQQQGIVSGFKILFGKKEKPTPEQDRVMQTVQNVIGSQVGLGGRLYRTRMGFRLIVTTRSIDAESSQALELLEQLQADPLYIRLCKSQKCYRARLTPKHWRIGIPKPPVRYPFETEAARQLFTDWLQEYEQKRKSFATCALIGQIGSSSIDVSIESLIKLHDYYVLDGDKSLA